MKITLQIKKISSHTYNPFRFQGFWNDGYCHLKVYSKDENILFLCTQLPDYHGTSITNAVETIRNAAFERVIGDGIVSVEAEISVIEKIIKSKKQIEMERITAIRCALGEKSKWIEHYPPGVGLAPEGSYAVVEFAESGEPSWSYYEKGYLEKCFSGIDFSISKEELKNGINKSKIDS